MTFDATVDAVAMVLPIPVAPGSGEDAVDFIDLTKEPTFFERLYECFDRYGAPGGAFGSLGAETAFRSPPPLVVHEVGVFEASYVPSRADFRRLGVFRVHAENAQLRTQSHLFGAGSVLCALAGHGKVLALDSRTAVATWAEGRELSSADGTWLDENAR